MREEKREKDQDVTKTLKAGEMQLKNSCTRRNDI